MKRVLLTAAIVILVASAASAAPPIGGIFLFSGPSGTTNPLPTGISELFYTGPVYAETYIWIWCLPSVNGLKAAEFMLNITDPNPDNVIFFRVTQNPAITVGLGHVNTGIAVTYGTCQTAWVWTHYIRTRLFSSDPSVIEIVENPSSNRYQFAGCSTGYPKEAIKRLTFFLLNHNPGCLCAAVQEASWGAIKSLF